MLMVFIMFSRVCAFLALGEEKGKKGRKRKEKENASAFYPGSNTEYVCMYMYVCLYGLDG